MQLTDIRGVSDAVVDQVADRFNDLPRPLLAAIGAGDMAVDRGDVGADVVQLTQDASGALNHPDPVVRQSAMRPIDELRAQLSLEAGDVARDVRLDGEQRPRRRRERAVISDGDERGARGDRAAVAVGAGPREQARRRLDQRVVEVAAQRAGAELGGEPAIGEQLERARRDVERHAALGQAAALGEPADRDLGDPRDLGGAERVEHDDLIEPVDQLGAERGEHRLAVAPVIALAPTAASAVGGVTSLSTE